MDNIVAILDSYFYDPQVNKVRNKVSKKLISLTPWKNSFPEKTSCWKIPHQII